MAAAREGHAEIVKNLINLGANVNDKNKFFIQFNIVLIIFYIFLSLTIWVKK